MNDQYVLLEDYDRLIKVLDNFDKIIYTMAESEISEAPSEDEKEIKNKYPSLYALINTELKYGSYLFQLRERLFKSLRCNSTLQNSDEATLFREYDNLGEEVILKIQELAGNYYISIWNSLNAKEKFVLYDMAVDNITNFHNLATLVVLKEKGLLKFNSTNQSIRIFNKSFRNFILTKIKPLEAKQLQNKIQTESNWRTTRIAIILFFFIVGIIIFFTQQNLIKEITGFVVAFSSVVTILLGLLKGDKGEVK
jgi:hypothetical protein